MDTITIIELLLVTFVIQIVLQAYSIVDLFKRQNFRFFNRSIWAAIIIIGNIFGPIIYIIFRGKYDE